MSTEQNTPVATAPALTDETAIPTRPKSINTENSLSPVFVEAEKLLQRFAELTRETAAKAYEFFQKRGGEIGRELDDWFKAESEILRPVPVEITQTDEQIYVNASVPGFKPGEIEVSVKENTLILSGKTEAQEKSENENLVYTEWRSNSFFRSIPLEAKIDPENVKANLKDGILYLTLPKLPA